MQKKLILDILDYIDQNINSPISTIDIANYFHYNKDYIMRIFKRECHITIIDYIHRKRIYSSFNYLENSSYSILKISLLCGFHSQEYFCEIFKKVMGVSPILFRLFSLRDSNLTLSNIAMIQNNLLILKNYFDFINQYRTIIIPKTKLSLSIFIDKKTP
mgnify:CR=1 FL=1